MNALNIKQLMFLALSISPLFYLVYRIRNRKLIDLLTFIGLILIYILIHRRFIFGNQFVFHDTMWCHHTFYAIINQWLQNGYSIGWNPYMNGGEPLYIYSNYFLWAEFIIFSLLNKLFLIPVHKLINLYFAYVFISYFTFCFILFSIIFRKSSIIFFPTVVLIFSGITYSNLGQYTLSPLYLLPLIFVSIYLFLIKRRIAYLLWTFFFLSISTNHYFPHYAAFFIIIFCLFWYLGEFIFFKNKSSVNSKAFNKKYIIFILLISIIVLLPAISVYEEIKDYVSPTRGNVHLYEKQQGSQPCVNLPLKNYRFLFSIPKINPYSHAEVNLKYNHSVYFLGFVAILFFFLSFFHNRTLFYYSCVFSMLIIMYFALGDKSLLWRFFKTYVPLFYLRHSYIFSNIICLLIILISTCGFYKIIEGIKLRYLIILLTFLLSVYPCAKAANYINKEPFNLEPVIYPKNRTLYLQQTSPVPFDTAPIILKEAVASHPSDNFIFFRKVSYNNLLKKYPQFITGNIFLFSKKIHNAKTNITMDDLRNNSREISIDYIIDSDPNHIRIKTHIPEDGYLIRKENIHKGWKAKINNIKVPILKFENTFQVIEVHRGSLTIDFIFASIYPLYFWLHVICVFIGYIAFFYLLIKKQHRFNFGK